MPTSHDQSPFRLPLDRVQFRAALEKGQGRVLLHLVRHGVGGFADLITRACLRDLRYDPQCEDDRVEWLVRLLRAADMNIVERLVDTLGAAGGVEGEAARRDLDQQCKLAFRLAREGNRATHTALYAAFDADAASADPAGVTEIVDLDGPDGLIHIAERSGALVVNDPTMPVSDAPLARYESNHGPGSAERLLWSAARENETIAAYVMRLAAAEDADTAEVSRFLDVQSMTVKEILREIDSENPAVKEYALRGWGRKARKWELMEIVGRLYKEGRPQRMARYLSVFQSRAVPIFHRQLARYADHDDADVRWYAVNALANHRHPVVRNLALRRAAEGRNTERELRLFRNNYHEHDWRMIEEGLNLPEDTDQEHSVLSDVIDVFEENQCPDSRAPLLMVYERSTCSICRQSAVDLLLDSGLAPTWLLEECRYDCDGEIREAVTPPDGVCEQ